MSSISSLTKSHTNGPAVFDYEDMTPHGPLVWDFVKLEMELKVRALQIVFPVGDSTEQIPTGHVTPSSSLPSPPLTFPEAVARFELSLDIETEALNNGLFANWRDANDAETPEGRLRALLLGLRRQAKKCLEVETGRGRRWLHEYYFGLAAYATYCGRFSTYRSLELQAAYATGGVAAARFLWAVNRLHFTEEDGTAQAKSVLEQNHSEAQLMAPDHLGHEPRLAFATVFARSANPPFIEASVRLLDELRREFPHVPEVWQELVLALLEQARLTSDLDQRTNLQSQASDLLSSFDQETHGLFHLDVELICRFGRLWKDRGDQCLADHLKRFQVAVAGLARVPPRSLATSATDNRYTSDGTALIAEPQTVSSAAIHEVRKWYQHDLEHYDRAAKIDPTNYYPAINAATLHLILGHDNLAAEVARRVLKNLEPITIPSLDAKNDHWILATRGEAHLILGNDQEAFRCYQSAIEQPSCDNHARSVMWLQIQRLFRFRPAPQLDFQELLLNSMSLS